MTVNAEYQCALQKQYIVGRSVPEMVASARVLLDQIEDPDQFLEIRLDALVMVARTLEANWRKFNAPIVGLPGAAYQSMENVKRREGIIREWLGDPDTHAKVCGPLCPEHGDARDTNLSGVPGAEV